MIPGRGYGFGRALGAHGYGYASIGAVVRNLVLQLTSTIVRLIGLESKL